MENPNLSKETNNTNDILPIREEGGFFSARGRIGRLTFFKRVILLLAGIFAIAMVEGSNQSAGYAAGMSFEERQAAGAPYYLMAFLYFFVAFILHILQMIKRLKDLGWSPIAIVVTIISSFIPFVFIGSFIVLFTLEGTKGKNQYNI